MMENGPKLSLKPGELIHFVSCMEPSKIEAIGNTSWIDWHIGLQKLNQQAAYEATYKMEEQIKECLVLSGKLPVLVYDVISIQVWRSKIYPHIIKLKPVSDVIYGGYLALAHEMYAVGLLETVMFHEEGVQCISKVAVDLLQYAIEQLVALQTLMNKGYPALATNYDIKTIIELNGQKNNLQVGISMSCISIVRFISEYMETTGAIAAICTYLYKTHDVPSLISHLLLLKPWKRTNKNGDLEVFNYGGWNKPTEEEKAQMHRNEIQLWLCLRQLLLEPRLAHFYTIDAHRHTVLRKIQSKLTSRALKQLPPLVKLMRFMLRLSEDNFTNLPKCPNSVKNPGFGPIEVVPQIKDAYMKEVEKRAEVIAQTQLLYFHLDGSDSSRKTARKLVDLMSFNRHAAVALDSDGAKCAHCGLKASKRCSRCKHEWYCGRECQTKQWPEHKSLCKMFSALNVGKL